MTADGLREGGGVNRTNSFIAFYAVYSIEMENEEDTVAATSLSIQSKWHREVSDFENHLDEPQSADFYNTELTRKIKSTL